MTTQFSFGRVLIVAGVFSALMIPAVAGVAYADVSHHKPGSSAHHTTGTAKHTGVTTTMVTKTLTTRVVNAHIRNRPTTDKSAKTLDTLRKVGSTVRVLCHTTGSAVGHDTTWYHTASPMRGFIAGHWLKVTAEPAAGVPMCQA